MTRPYRPVSRQVPRELDDDLQIWAMWVRGDRRASVKSPPFEYRGEKPPRSKILAYGSDADILAFNERVQLLALPQRNAITARYVRGLSCQRAAAEMEVSLSKFNQLFAIAWNRLDAQRGNRRLSA